MQLIHRRSTPYTNEYPYRPIRPTTSKIIFLSCEGSVTEEEYIEVLLLQPCNQLSLRTCSKKSIVPDKEC